MTYQGMSGQIYELEEKRIAGGGEGNIYNIIGNSSLVAKVFREDKRDATREEKLRCMVSEMISKEQIKYITWPLDVIYGRNGFVGYIMARASNMQSLTSLYSTEKYDLRYRVLAAVNMCIAVERIHGAGQICGDLNPQNILINLDKQDRESYFRVMLVDADSYHYVSSAQKTYRCEVGLGDYIAPEIQKKLGGGMTLRNVPLPTYTQQTDLFALAVHIFCLLMNGCHPFACAKDTNVFDSNIQQMKADGGQPSVALPQPVQNIKDGFFPFYEKRPGIVPPIYAPDFSSLPPELQKMFIRTFVDGYRNPDQRVSAGQWVEVLQPMVTVRFRSSFGQCSKGHFYFIQSSVCPLCEIDNRIINFAQKKRMPEMPPQNNATVSEPAASKHVANSGSNGNTVYTQPQWSGKNSYTPSHDNGPAPVVSDPTDQKNSKREKIGDCVIKICKFISLLCVLYIIWIFVSMFL